MADTSKERLAAILGAGWIPWAAQADLLAMIDERDAEIARLRMENDALHAMRQMGFQAFVQPGASFFKMDERKP